MNEKELRRLLTSGETETVEFKEIPNETFYKAISAFANTRGGTILLGLDKKGNITGIETSSRFLEDLTNRIVNKLSFYPEIETMDIKGKRAIIVGVSRSGFPVSYEGRYYERVGNTTRQMNPQKLRAFILSSMPWDSLINDISLEEIDPETVERFIRLAVESKRLTDISLNEPTQLVLKKLELINLSSFKNLATGVSEKTLYRDLQDLVNKGILIEFGEKKGRKYKLG